MYLILIVLLIKTFEVSLGEPQVTLSSGTYRGQTLTYNGVSYNSFKGIKFATAKRFEEGVPVPASRNVYSATNFGPACYQNVDLGFSQFNFTVSEDCLYLNVYSPDLRGSLPTIVVIYGGTYMNGATSLYRPDYFMETKRVVIVTIAYRLSAFGFLYFGDPKYPANLGIRDQIIALKWVQNNIRHFGGDPRRVTINGESAGATSVDTLLHSPMAKGLFNAAISESGVAAARWALQPVCAGLQKRNDLALRIGCGLSIPILGENADSLVKCLRSKSADELVRGNGQLAFVEDQYPAIVEPSSVSNPVITYFPWLQATESSDLVPWINGVNSNEGILIADMIPNNILIQLGVDIFSGWILPNSLFYRYLAESPLLATLSIKYHYLKSFTTNLKEFTSQLVTDGIFDYPLVRTMQTVRSPTYVYYFDYRQPSQTKGVGHTGELMYFWPNITKQLSIPPGDKNAFQLSRNLINTWINFAYNQVPNFPNAKWERYDYRKDQVFIIDNKGARMGPNPNKNQNNFWRTLNIDNSPKNDYCFLH